MARDEKKKAETSAKWRARNKERKAAYALVWRAANKDRIRTSNRMRCYGVIDTELFSAQGGRCACCQAPISITDHIDHCHDTGKVRGMVCRACNITLGMSKDDPLRLRACADFIERHKEQ